MIVTEKKNRSIVRDWLRRARKPGCHVARASLLDEAINQHIAVMLNLFQHPLYKSNKQGG